MSEGVSPLRKFLLDLSRELTDQNVEDLKYLAEFGDGVSEQCKSPLGVFRELQRVGKIAPEKLDFLKELMKNITRHDLVTSIGI